MPFSRSTSSGGIILGDVNLPGLQGRHPGRGCRRSAGRELVRVGLVLVLEHAGAPVVVRVFLDGDMALGRPLHETCTARCRPDSDRSPCRTSRRPPGRRSRSSHQQAFKERRERLLQHHLGGGVVDDLGASWYAGRGEIVKFAFAVGAVTRSRLYLTAWALNAVPSWNFDVLLQLERVALAVRRHLPGLGQGRKVLELSALDTSVS